ncbi:MAG: cytochrome c [Nitrospirota bacterium]|nr:cytochrome c [Nitrospirota bacterium]
MAKRMAVIASFVAVVFAGSWVLAEVRPANPKKGQALYEQHCARCHGSAGDGLGPDARDLIVPPANFLSLRSRSKADWELMVAISRGVLFSPMHGWADRLSEQDMLDVLGYIRTLAPFNPVT